MQHTQLNCSAIPWYRDCRIDYKIQCFFSTSKPIACVLLRLNIKKKKYTHSEGSLVDHVSSGANEFYVKQEFSEHSSTTVNFALTETADLAVFPGDSEFKACSYRRQHQQSRQSRGLHASKQHRHLHSNRRTLREQI